MFSYFTNHSQNIPVGSLTLEELHHQLVNPDREPFISNVNLVQRLRATTDMEEQKKIKAQLSAFCPGSMVDTKQANATIEQKNIRYSGFAQIDIDLHDNPNMHNAASVRDKLAEIPYIALAAISARGKGVWALMALEEPAKFTQYAESVYGYFQKARVTIDKSKSRNPTELRYFAPDAGAFLKTAFELFPLEQLKDKPKRQQSQTIHADYPPPSLVSLKSWVTETTGYSFIDGQKHNYIFWLSYALRKNGLSETDVYNTIYSNILSADQIKSNAIPGGIARANANGIARSDLSENTQLPPPKQNITVIEPAVNKPSIAINSLSDASALFLQTCQFIIGNSESDQDNVGLPEPEFEIPVLKPATRKLRELEDAFIHLAQQPQKHQIDFSPIISLFDKYKRVYPTDEQLADLELMINS